MKKGKNGKSANSVKIRKAKKKIAIEHPRTGISKTNWRYSSPQGGNATDHGWTKHSEHSGLAEASVTRSDEIKCFAAIKRNKNKRQA